MLMMMFVGSLSTNHIVFVYYFDYLGSLVLVLALLLSYNFPKDIVSFFFICRFLVSCLLIFKFVFIMRRSESNVNWFNVCTSITEFMFLKIMYSSCCLVPFGDSQVHILLYCSEHFSTDLCVDTSNDN